MEINDATAAAAAHLYPSMAEQPTPPWVRTQLDKLYQNSPDMFVPEPPPKLPREAGLYPNSPAMHAPILKAQEAHWQGQAAALPAAVRDAVAAALAALPATVRGTLVGAGVAEHPDVIAWLGRRP